MVGSSVESQMPCQGIGRWRSRQKSPRPQAVSCDTSSSVVVSRSSGQLASHQATASGRRGTAPHPMLGSWPRTPPTGGSTPSRRRPARSRRAGIYQALAGGARRRRGHPGQGPSRCTPAAPFPPPGYSLETEVEWTRRVADDAGIDRFHLVGYSAGGAWSPDAPALRLIAPDGGQATCRSRGCRSGRRRSRRLPEDSPSRRSRSRRLSP